MEYICENTQHFGWGSSCRLRDPDGNITHLDVTAKQIAEGFVLPKEREPYTMTDEEKGPAEEPSSEPDPPAPDESPASDR